MDRRSALRAGTGIAASAWVAGCGPKDGTASSAEPRDPSGTNTPRTPGGSPSTDPTGGRPDWSALAKDLDGTLIRPGDDHYDTARQLYNTRFDGLRPAAVAYVAGTDDVRTCLDFARRSGTRLSIRSGGHSYAGWSSGQNHLVLDVARLSTVTSSGDSATVGAGAKLIDVYTKLGAHGRTIPAGSCPTVGVSGLTLGGGHGVLSRSYGLTCDNLIGATIITADGTRLDCDTDHNAELFWGLRGAGCGNFGVVTDLRFRTHPAPDVVTGYLTWPWSRAAAVVGAWQAWGPDQPDHIWSALHLDAEAGGPPRISVPALSTGSRADLENAVDRLAEAVGTPASSVSLHPHDYLHATLSYAGCAGMSAAQCHLPGSTPGRTESGRLRRETYTARSDFYDGSLSPSGIHSLLGQVERLGSFRGDGAGSVALTALGGAVNRVDPTATSFVHRRSRFLAQYIASDALSRTGWLDALHGSMRRYASGAAYQNYTDPSLADWRTAYYGDAADRLTQLKKRYDPHRLFDFPQAL